jgi:hypothetical protein
MAHGVEYVDRIARPLRRRAADHGDDDRLLIHHVDGELEDMVAIPERGSSTPGGGTFERLLFLFHLLLTLAFLGLTAQLLLRREFRTGDLDSATARRPAQCPNGRVRPHRAHSSSNAA